MADRPLQPLSQETEKHSERSRSGPREMIYFPALASRQPAPSTNPYPQPTGSCDVAPYGLEPTHHGGVGFSERTLPSAHWPTQYSLFFFLNCQLLLLCVSGPLRAGGPTRGENTGVPVSRATLRPQRQKQQLPLARLLQASFPFEPRKALCGGTALFALHGRANRGSERLRATQGASGRAGFQPRPVAPGCTALRVPGL